MKQLLPILALVLLSSACRHVTTKVPGVLDLRSDGSDAPAATTPPKTSEETARGGFGGFMKGDGVVATGADVTITDRKYWVIGLFSVINESATEEIQDALGDGAMRKVMIGDGLTFMDVGIAIIGQIVAWVPIVGLVNFILPPFDVTFSGTRIQTGGGGGVVEPPPPTDGVPPAAGDPSAPSTTPPGT